MSALPRSPSPASPPSGWLFGPLPDLLLGCGVGYALLLAFLCFYGPSVRGGIAPAFLPFLTVLIGAPHYGATILRVYERREDRRAYALFAVHATVALAIAFVVATQWLWLGSLILTVYLTWSPWHYTGQNYGLAVLFLRRRGVPLDAVTKRWVYAAFLLSYAVVFVAIHSDVPGSQYTPPIFVADGYHVLSLHIPSAPGSVLFDGALGGTAVAAAVAAVRLLRRASLAAIAPALALGATQALWFALPVAMRRYGLLSHLEPFAPEYAGWYFFWAALAHSIQYVWVTSYFARSAAGYTGLAPYLAKSLLAGAAVWSVPALLFAPDLLGRLPYDAGLGALVAAVVNLHHFVLDGAIWKLRDGRIARILLRKGDPATPTTPADVAAIAAGARPLAAAAWAVGAVSLGIFVASYWETEFGLRKAYERGDVPRMRTALARLDRMGRESANNHLQLGRMLAARGDPVGALREMQRSVQLHATPDAWVALSETLEGVGKPSEAREAMDNALALAPNSGPILYRAAGLASREGDSERARSLLERAVELDPERKLYRVALERARERSGDLPSGEATP
jgi:tetratricopeptide (TPR) repeat protein